MKKFFTLFVGMAIGFGASAQSFDSNGLQFEVLSSEEKTCTLVGPDDYYGEYLTIPEIVNYDGETYTVTEVRYDAMRWATCRYLQLPSTLESIGNYGFWNIHQLKEITIPSSVKRIGAYAFGAAHETSVLVLGESSSLVIDTNAFGSNTPIAVIYTSSLTPATFEQDFLSSFPSNPAVFVPRELVETYQEAWEGANVLPDIPATSISFPTSYYSLEPGSTLQLAVEINPDDASVVYGVNSSNGITVSRDGLVEIGALTEYRDYKITAYTYGGMSADCYIYVGGLEKFTLDGLQYAVIPGVDHEVGLYGLEENFTVLNIPATVEYNGETYAVTTIREEALNWRSDLYEVTIPSTIRNVGNYNLNYCSNLMKVTIEDSETPLTLGAYCFTENSNLESIYIGRNFKRDSSDCYRWNRVLSTITLGPKVTEVPAYAFEGNDQLHVIESQNPVPPTIGDWAFGYYIQHIYVAPENVEAYMEAWGEYYPRISSSIEATDLIFDPQEITIYTGQRIKLPLIVEPADAPVNLISSNPYLISVDEDGYLSYYYWMEDTGEVLITATTLNGLKAECRVTADRWFTFVENTIIMEPGTTRQIEVNRTEAFGDGEISWEVEGDNSCVTVNENGMITALEGGNASIIARANVPDTDDYFYYRLRVEVRNYPQSVVAVDPVISVWSDHETAINLNYEPEDDEYLTHALTWTVENPEIAEVLDYGNSYGVRGLQGGTTNIKGVTPNGLEVEIEVQVKAQLQEMIFNNMVDHLSPGESLQLEFTTKPEVTNLDFTYSSDNESIVTIDENGLMTGVNPGSANVYVWYEAPWGSSYSSHRVEVYVAPEEVTLANPDEPIEVYVNEYKTLALNFTPMVSGLNMDLTWKFDNNDLIGVSSYETWSEEYGMYVKVYEFRGLALGETHFVGTTINGKAVEGTVIVKEHPGPDNVIIANEGEVNVVFRDNADIPLEFVSDAADVDRTMTWKIDDDNIASIYSREVWNDETQQNELQYYVEGKNLGKTKFTGESVNGHEVHGVIIVEGIDIWYGDRNAREMHISTGETVQLEFEANPTDLTSTLDFVSYNTDLFTVTQEGEVTGIAPGESRIVAYYTVNNYGYYDDIDVIVHPAEGVALSRKEVTIGLYESESLKAYLPLGYENAEIKWESSNPDALYLYNSDDSSVDFYCYAPGEYEITATTSEGLSASCIVRCYEVTLDNREVIMGVGMTRQVSAQLNPMPEDEEISSYWYTNNEDVATVDENGVITAVGVGWTTIGVQLSTADRTFSAYVYVEVLEDFVAVTNIMLNETNIAAKEGEKVQLIATVDPADATVTGLVWSSSDEAVATVDQSGLVTILTEGTAVITVSATDGSDVKAVCYISGLSGIDSIFVEGEPCDIYTVNGVLVKKSATADDFNKLSNGLYIIRCGGQTMKVLRGSN